MTISQELNEKLTRVGPGTPGGELMRRYWHPIAATTELDHNPTKRVRLLCEIWSSIATSPAPWA